MCLIQYTLSYPISNKIRIVRMNVTLKLPSCKHCCSGKLISVIYLQCEFVALRIQSEMRMHHLWPTRLYKTFPHYPIKGAIFVGGMLLNTKYVFWFSLRSLSETLVILRRIEQILNYSNYSNSEKHETLSQFSPRGRNKKCFDVFVPMYRGHIKPDFL
jgi:hypothetical protein